jgi:hypothetical protein
VLKALVRLLADSTAGDPMTGLKWTYRSLRRLAKALYRRGTRVSPNTVARLLRRLDYSLRTNRKTLAEVRDPDRDRQFRYLSRLRRYYLARGWPVISVDTKKKELVGRFKNPGRTWRRTAHQVLAHDFPSWADGRGIPYGIYDVAHNDGLVVVGTSHDTPGFAGTCIRRWWREVARRRYPGARRLLIEADSGGSNDYRKWAWKSALQAVADEFGLAITVTHYPPGASKWNPIDHRMFSLISGNWRGEPLTSYEVMLKHIRRTRSGEGFRCRARLDTKAYPAEGRATREDKARVRLRPRATLPQWNYTILPHARRRDC